MPSEPAAPPPRPDWPVTLLLLSFPFVFAVGGLILALGHDEPLGWLGVIAFVLALSAVGVRLWRRGRA
jgi:hypothetical protein